MPTQALRGALVALVAIVMLPACGKSKEGATQVVAKVNKGELTVHQLNFALQRANVSTPEQAKQASRQVLERLVEQELIVQAATEKKLDRDPRVVQLVEAARREVLARAYLEQLGGAAGKPSEQEIKDYYAKHPALFSERRIYSFREISLAPNAPMDAIRAELEKVRSLEALAAWLKAQSIEFRANAFAKPAEQLPLESLSRFHAMKDGDVSIISGKQGVALIQLAASRSEPYDEARAKPMIEQYLGNQKRGTLIKAELDRLKNAAKIEYVGEFAKKADAPAAAQSDVAPSAEPQTPVEAPASAASVPTTDSGLEEGLKGLK